MYFFYLDESGQISYNSKDKLYTLTALGIQADEWRPIHNQVVQLKESIFKRPYAGALEIKSNWLRLPQERAKRDYLASLDNDGLSALGNGLYDILLSQDYPKTLLSVVINKDEMLKTYGIQAHHPNIYAYALILERISLFLNDKNDEGIVICDRNANSIDDLLNEKHILQCLDDGYTWRNLKNIRENLFFVDSKFNNLIQLVDICCYNVFRAFTANEPNYDYFQKILPLFYVPPPHTLMGTGISLKPTPSVSNHSDCRKMVEFLRAYK